MILYKLRCVAGHEFEAWFNNSGSFDDQAKRGLLSCAVCGHADVDRALMAPAVPRKRGAAAPPAKPDPQPEPVAESTIAKSIAGADRLPDQVRAVLQRVRADVERNCDYVGADFAEEARRIHYGESDKRGIYGETTPDQAEALADEGIDVARIPWVPRSDS